MSGRRVPPEILRLAEAFVFASPRPVAPSALQRVLSDDFHALEVLTALREHCAGRGIVLVELGEGWTFRTAPDLASDLRQALTETRKIPRVALECLVIIAYTQPVTRSEIEDIRGVALSQGTMDVLLETGMIQPWGRRDAPGRPSLWVTTQRFLSHFGLSSIRDLPGYSSFPGPMLGSGQEGEDSGDEESGPSAENVSGG